MASRQPSSASELFEHFAATYDAGRRKLIPPFDAFYGTAVEVACLCLDPAADLSVLDIGAGTGLLTARMAAALPKARFTLLDASPAMLEHAPERLGADWARCTTVIGDALDALPDGPFDAVVTALAVHHLDDAGKAELYRRILDRLRPGGVFVNAEQVAGPTAALDARYVDRWLLHTRECGATDEDHAEARCACRWTCPRRSRRSACGCATRDSSTSTASSSSGASRCSEDGVPIVDGFDRVERDAGPRGRGQLDREHLHGDVDERVRVDDAEREHHRGDRERVAPIARQRVHAGAATAQ